MIAIVDSLRRGRAGLPTLAVIGVLCVTVIAAHSGLDHTAPAEIVAICLAITETAAVGVALAAMAPLRASVAATPGWPAAPLPASPLAPSARAGPAQLQVFRL